MIGDKASEDPQGTQLEGKASAIVVPATPQDLSHIGLGERPVAEELVVAGVLRQDQHRPACP